jgi:predicted anti-sigma-YlaC factor YlaD
MKCREVRRTLVAYLDGEVMPSERTLIDAHVSRCEACAEELRALSSGRSAVSGALKTAAAQASPSPQAWIHLQTSLAREAQRVQKKQKTSLLQRKGDRPMRLGWRIALGTVGAVVLAAAVIAAVPASRAAAGDFFAEVFNIQTGPTSQLTYLPAGFALQPEAVAGSLSVSAQGQEPKGQEQALYRSGEKFVWVKTATNAGDQAMPQGQATEVNGIGAVLQTGLSGSADLAQTPDGAPPAPQAGQNQAAGQGPVTVQGSGSAVIVGGGTVITGTANGSVGSGLSVAPDSGSQPATETAGAPLELPAVAYQNANSLTWVVDGTRVEVLTNLSVEELTKIAAGLVVKK